MAISIGRLSLPGPRHVLGPALAPVRGAARWGARATRLLGGLPERVELLLERIESLVDRIDELAARADQLARRVEQLAAGAERTARTANSVTGDAAALITRARVVTDGAASVVSGAEKVSEAAATVVGQASQATHGAAELLGALEPVATRGAPLAATFVDELSEQEVAAAVRLVDQLPRLAEHLETDIMPILATLDRVGPDMHELLNVVKDLRHAINGIPGLAYFRRRGQRPVPPDTASPPPPA